MTNESKSALKGGARLTLLALLLLLILILIYYFCNQGKESLVKFREPIKAPHGVAFIDINGSNTNVQKVKVTLIDPEKMVVSSNGFRFESVEVIGGVMSIGLSEKASFSEDKPYRFFIRTEANGYMTNIHSVVVTKDEPNYVPIYMAKLESLPPSGLAAEQRNITAVENGVLQRPDTLRAIPAWAEILPVTIVMEEGTEFLCHGKRITAQGPLSYRLLYGAPRDSNANRVFPGGFQVTDAVDESGKALATPADPFFFTTAGWFSMEMNIGDERVNEFSKPLMVEMPVDKYVINPADGEPVQVGDTIPLWSMDNNSGVWTRESFAIVKDDDGGMKVRFPVRHLSNWNIDLAGVRCASNLNITYIEPPAAFGGDHFTDFVDVSSPSTGVYLKSESVNFDPVDPIAVPPQGTLVLKRIPASGTYKLLVHSGPDPSSLISHTSDNFSCGDVAVKFLRPFDVPSAACINLEFTNAGGNPILCRNSFWYKNAAATLFTYGGAIDAGLLRITSGLGVQTINLWFYDPGSSHQAVIGFDVDFGMSPGTSQSSFTYHIGGVAQPIPVGTTISVTRVNAPPPQPCPAATFTFTLPNLVSTGTCPPGL